jgi:hypothetical protein
MFRLVVATVLGLSLNAWSSPSVYINASNKLRDVKNTKEAKFIGDHLNKNAVYVLPPSMGLIELKNFRATTNLAFCDELSDLVTYSKARTTELGRLATKRERILDQKIDLEAGIKGVDAELNQLRKDNPILVDYERLLKDPKRNPEIVSKIEKENVEALKKYNELKTAAKEIQSTFEELDKRYNVLEGRIADIKKVFDGLYEKFAKREGGYANFAYDTGWDAQVRQLQTDNPGYTFERVFTRDVKIYAKFIGAGDRGAYEATLPAILDYVVNGETYSPNSDKPQSLAAMPTAMSAQVRLSLAGACALAKPDLFQVKRADSGVPVFGLAATYSFPSVFAANVKITYNRHTVYNEIKKEGKGTAVFTTRQAKKVTDDKEAWSHMKVEWQDNSDGELSEADKQKIILELRKEVITEVLEIMAIPNADRSKPSFTDSGNSGMYDTYTPRSRWDNTGFNNPGFGGYGRNGYGYDGSGTGSIGGLCDQNSIYCVLGGFILKGMNAIFGGDRVEADFYAKVKAEVTRELSTSTAGLRTGITVFTSEKAAE